MKNQANFADKENKRLKDLLSSFNHKKRKSSEGQIRQKYSSSIDSLKNEKKSRKGFRGSLREKRGKSITRNRSRDVSPLDPKASLYDARKVTRGLKGTKKISSNLLINFKKLYRHGKKGKEYSIKN